MKAISNAGKTISEYVLILSLVMLVAIPAVGFLGNTMTAGLFDTSTQGKAGSDQLASLLDPTHWDDSGMGGTVHPYGSTQLVDKLAFDFNPATGLVEMVDASSGATTTSGEGTLILVQGLQDLLANYPGVMTPTQESLLTDLINQGLAIAAEEKRLLTTYPALATTTPDNLNFFVGGGADLALYQGFLDYSNTYDSLMTSLTGSDALVLQMKDTIDVNSSLITQLANKNFIQAQLTYDGLPSEISATESATVRAKDIDITKITIDETPTVTEKAAKTI